MQLKLITVAGEAARKGLVMEINNKKHYLSQIRVSFCMLLFAICLTMNVFFCGTYNLYELLDNTAAIETQVISESVMTNEDGDNTACLNTLFLNKNKSDNNTIAKSIFPILITAAVPKVISLSFFLIIVFLFLPLFILLPDDWTLVDQKVRLDN
ncbi:hypothetical protein [Murimonas intestini]|uniref:Uncharacterized protein n=1 Tax=Murimonas intestini TaxID=1337051 RepID=A0AB73T680_9FIRM|nr:hypothetical protein [Murimonas intestini]MCR1842156.1 hypothetical protein [Murimonas intestini]MCR1864892.1 hypothetical protein [Murimonas intestini]MCR1884220.1 hypothetical protein [Murimonas intestini]